MPPGREGRTDSSSGKPRNLEAISVGGFLDVLEYSPDSWLDDLVWLTSLPQLQHVEVWLEWLPSTSGELTELVDLLRGQRVLVHAPFMGVSLTSHWPEHREVSLRRIQHTLDVAAELSASVVTVHPGPAPFFLSRDHQFGLLLEAYDILCRHADGPLVAIENMPAGGSVTCQCVVSVNDFSELLKLEPSLNITMDVGHFIRSGESYGDLLRAHGERVVNIHVHDAIPGGRDHLSLGRGVLDVKQLFADVESAGYKGYVGIETLGRPDTAESFQLCHEVIHKPSQSDSIV